MKEISHQSIRRLILASMILLPFIPFILSLGIGYYQFTTALKTRTLSSLKRIVEDHGQMIDAFLRERQADLEFVTRTYSFDQLQDANRLETVFNHLQKKSGAFADLGIFNETGLHVAYHGPYALTGILYNDAPWFKEVQNRGFYISDIFMGYRKVPHFIIAITGRQGNRQWILRATIDSLVFNEIVERVRIGKTGEAYLLNADGVLQTDRRSGGKLMDRPQEAVAFPPSLLAVETFLQRDGSGKPYLHSTMWLKEKGWLLVVRQEESEVFEALRKAAVLIAWISILGGGAIVFVAFYLTNRIIRRLEQMDAEKEQLGQQLIRAGRLAELGEMTAGFAHEINNPLQIIRSEHSLIEMILSELKEKIPDLHSDPLSELEDSLGQIKLQTIRCAEITQAILKFGRQKEPDLQSVSIQEFLPEITQMVLKRAAVHGIRIEHHIIDTKGPVQGDPSQLQQVFLNLLNNAVDAIIQRHGSRGGNIVIETDPESEGFIEVRVKDDGCGISRENLNKIFTPFFTTKPVGKGTGLGLPVSYGIITNMGGSMEITSKEGVGTTVSLRLPVNREEKVHGA